MDIFSRDKLLARLVVALVLVNLLLVGLFWWRSAHRPSPAKAPAPARDLSVLLRQELRLNDSQTLVLKTIRNGFFEKEKALSDSIRANRDSMNRLMFSPGAADGKLEQLARAVAEGEYRMEMLRIGQATQVRALCTPEQLARLEKLVREIRDYLRPEESVKANEAPPGKK